MDIVESLSQWIDIHVIVFIFERQDAQNSVLSCESASNFSLSLFFLSHSLTHSFTLANAICFLFHAFPFSKRGIFFLSSPLQREISSCVKRHKGYLEHVLFLTHPTLLTYNIIYPPEFLTILKQLEKLMFYNRNTEH